MHLLRSCRLQKLIKFLGIHPVLCRPSCHRQHLPASCVKFPVNILERLLQNEMIHYMFTIQLLAYLIQKRKINCRRVRTQRSYLPARSHFRRQLIKISNQMTTDISVTCTNPVTTHLNIRQYILSFICKIQIVLDKSWEISDTEYIILRQTPHLQQAASLHDSRKLFRHRSITGKNFRFRHRSTSRYTEQAT